MNLISSFTCRPWGHESLFHSTSTEVCRIWPVSFSSLWPAPKAVWWLGGGSRAKGMSIPQDQCTQNEFQTKALKKESFDSVDNHHYFLWCSNICHCVLKTHKESTHCFKSRGLSRLDLPTSGILVAARGDPTAPPSLESIAILDLFLPFLGEGFRGSALDFWILVAMIMLSCELLAHCQCH